MTKGSVQIISHTIRRDLHHCSNCLLFDEFGYTGQKGADQVYSSLWISSERVYKENNSKPLKRGTDSGIAEWNEECFGASERYA